MSQPRQSLLKTLLKSLMLPAGVAALIGVLLVYNLVTEEYDELQDNGLKSKAELILALYDALAQDGALPSDAGLSTLLAFEIPDLEPDERSLYWLLNLAGKVVVSSPGATQQLLELAPSEGLHTAEGFRFVVASSGGAHEVVVATPLTERNEAVTDVLLGVLTGFTLLGLLFAAAAFLAVRRSVGVIARLSANIASKSPQNLTPIDRANAFAELEPAVDTLDALLARLDKALAAERAFATNAAHELRTPVAISLANVQRLKAKLQDAGISTETAASAGEIEQGLKRLVRLIETLLQMSRAQSGLGSSAEERDLAPVVDLLLNELRVREPSDDRLVILPPTGPWLLRVDPDALGIMLNNLFENALKHASGPAPMVVDASVTGQISVSNDCEALSPEDLDAIKLRSIRKASVTEGFGLGLSIVQELCEESGGTFELFSPQNGSSRGFTAVLRFEAA